MSQGRLGKEGLEGMRNTKKLRPDINFDELWLYGDEWLDPAEMNETEKLPPTEGDSDLDDLIITLTSDGKCEMNQWWWVARHVAEYPHWLPHPDATGDAPRDRNRIP